MDDHGSDSVITDVSDLAKRGMTFCFGLVNFDVIEHKNVKN